MILALDQGTAAVFVALIGSVIGPTIAWLLVRRDSRSRIGTPNGRGNIVEMVERIDARTERLVDSQAGQDRRLARLEERVGLLPSRPLWRRVLGL